MNMPCSIILKHGTGSGGIKIYNIDNIVVISSNNIIFLVDKSYFPIRTSYKLQVMKPVSIKSVKLLLCYNLTGGIVMCSITEKIVHRIIVIHF